MRKDGTMQQRKIIFKNDIIPDYSNNCFIQSQQWGIWTLLDLRPVQKQINTIFFNNKNYITFHASSGGEKVIRLPKRARVLEVYENVEYTSSSYEIRFSIKRGQTKMFRLFYE